MKNNNFYSKHIFLMPFRWDYKESNNLLTNKLSLESRLNLIKFKEILDKNNWIKSTYHTDSPIDYYNDATYYLEFVRSAISELNSENSTVYCYEYNLVGKEFFYEIDVKKTDFQKTYKLNISRITLNVYDTGILNIGIHLTNFEYTDKEDILKINDFGRRIYPQFLDTGANPEDSSSDLLGATRNAFLANYIKIYFAINNITEIIYEESFEQFRDINKFKMLISKDPANLPNAPIRIADFLGANFKTIINQSKDKDEIIIRSILDDRNFVICWYGNNEEIQNLKGINKKSDDTFKNYNYTLFSQNDYWLKYLFIDNSSNTIQSQTMRKKYAKLHTYDRWIEYGTLYGISRYSFVCLTGIDYYTLNHISEHVTKRYYEFIQLALAQRASIIKFSDEATLISGKDENSISKEAEYLHKKYMQFVNRLYFREVTAQEQGIEMYQMLTSLMDLERDKNMLNLEIDELHQFVSIKEQEKQVKEAAKLNKIAMLFLPFTVVFSILGSNIYNSMPLNGELDLNAIIWIIIGTLISLTIVCILKKHFKIKMLEQIKKKT